VTWFLALIVVRPLRRSFTFSVISKGCGLRLNMSRVVQGPAG
jgi:hypothetical protein